MQSTPFPLLGDSHYGAFVGPLSHRGGANPSTHIATVRYPVQTAPIISVVKLMPADGLRACNEALAWLFLRANGVRVARNAAILSLTEAKAVKVLGRKLVPKTLVHDKHVLAWAAQQFDYRSIQALFSGSMADERWLDMLQTVEGAAIAAFDETFLNVDRNPGNVLCFGTEAVSNTAVRGLHATQMLAAEQSQWPFNDQAIAFDEGAGNPDRHIFNLVRRAARDYVLIDHGYLLRTLGAEYPLHWAPGVLESMVGSNFENKLHYNTYPVMGRNSPTVCQQGCARGMLFADVLDAALRRSMFEVSFWCSKLLPGTSARWLHFLSARMKQEQMAELLHRRFGTIALHARTPT